jgi:hypothetical protein
VGRRTNYSFEKRQKELKKKKKQEAKAEKRRLRKEAKIAEANPAGVDGDGSSAAGEEVLSDDEEMEEAGADRE